MNHQTISEVPESTDPRARALGVPVVLHDGSGALIRPFRPSDGELVLRGFERLSPESRRRRFLAATPKLTGSMLRNLTDVDHHDHEAIVALDEQGAFGVGIAHYFRHPARRDRAEVAVTVIDDWQGRGLGTLLLELLSARACQEEISTFTALLLAANKEMLDLFEALGPVRIVDHASGTLEIEVAVSPVEVPPELKQLLWIAAQHDVG